MSTIRPTAPAIPDYEAEDVLIVSEPEQLRALADDLRAKIVALLRVRARSTQELANELGLPKGTVGHHLKVLERAGLIHVVRTRQVRALTEKYYGRVARLFIFRTEELPGSAPSIGAAALRQAASEIERAPESGGIQFAVVRARLSPADVRKLEQRIERLIDAFRAREKPDGRLVGLATGLWTIETDDA
jgi:DNA-binding transcriptional ArsR family regulator